jgi:hypothetical protein
MVEISHFPSNRQGKLIFEWGTWNDNLNGITYVNQVAISTSDSNLKVKIGLIPSHEERDA